jgi:CBS domain-containing protein
MSVGEILKGKGMEVETIASDATVAEAVERLRDESIGALVVSADGQSVEGVFSERDIVSGLADHPEDLLSMKVGDLMTRLVKTCSPEDSVEQVLIRMTEQRARHFPVLDDGRLVGIVSIGDLVKNRLDEVELENKVLRDTYIAGR